MKVKHIKLNGDRTIKDYIWEKPNNTEDQIVVKNIMSGICSSDVSMYTGKMDMLPEHMHGHEGLGQVVAVGKNVTGVKVDDIVATRGEPAFADIYNVRDGEFVVVPEALPKYILEPVACAVNIADIVGKIKDKSVLIIGSGFLARVIYQVMLYNNKTKDLDVVVVGNAYNEWWSSQGIVADDFVDSTYDVIIDLSDRAEEFNIDRLNNSGHYIMCAEKTTPNVDWAPFLWKNITVSCPSPRAKDFHGKMVKANVLVQKDIIQVDDMWVKGYSRDEAETAFANRASGIDKGRTYLTWQQ